MIRKWLLGIVAEAIERARKQGFRALDGTTLEFKVEAAQAEIAIDRLQQKVDLLQTSLNQMEPYLEAAAAVDRSLGELARGQGVSHEQFEQHVRGKLAALRMTKE